MSPSSPKTPWFATLVLLSVPAFSWLITRALAEPPAPPSKLSAIIPADDLADQFDRHVKDTQKDLAEEEGFEDAAGGLRKRANAMVVLALVLEKHDSPHKLTGKTTALFHACRELAAADKDRAAALAAFAKVEAALQDGGAGAPPTWGKVASLGRLMAHSTTLNDRIKRSMRRLKEKSAESARDAAELAALAQAFVYDTHEVKDPNDLDAWYGMCDEMRDAASELNIKLKAVDNDGAKSALERLAASCDDCHQQFRKEEKHD